MYAMDQGLYDVSRSATTIITTTTMMSIPSASPFRHEVKKDAIVAMVRGG
jgi:hypothetical protein